MFGLGTRSGSVISILLLIALAIAPAAAQAPETQPYDWLQFNFDQRKTGNNPSETILTAENVANLQKLFQVELPEEVDSAPVYLSGVNTADGVKDLVFVNTILGTLVAMDSLTGEVVWSRSNPLEGCIVNNGEQRDVDYPCFTTSGPAIDPNRQFIYSYSPNGYVHKYQVEDGTEITTDGWPQLTTLKPYDEKGSSHLAIATAQNGRSYLYVTHASYGFPPPGALGEYQGHLTTINLSDGSQNVFNTMCSHQNIHFMPKGTDPFCSTKEGGIWGRSGVVYEPETDRIYFSTGNGLFDPDNYLWGDSIIALAPDGLADEGMPLDSFTPENYADLDDLDLDLGSSSPLLVTAPEGSAVRNLIIQASKAQLIWVVNRDDMSGQGEPGFVGGEVSTFTEPINQLFLLRNNLTTWTNPEDGGVWVYAVNGTGGMVAFQVQLDEDGMPFLEPMWTNEYRGTSPIVANNVLYYANSNILRALNPATGEQYWETRDVGEMHWQSLIVVNGIVYVADKNLQFHAYSLDGRPETTGASHRPTESS